MTQHEIEALLRQRIGLNPKSVGSRSILRAVRQGMRQGERQGLADYLTGLKTSPPLFEALVESIVVPETSFFRNQASFVFLRQWIAREWLTLGLPNQSPLRVLSLPCSTGEEPYSIAISLLEEGLALDDFHIDAVDISALALAKAKAGVYSPYAFRRQTFRSDDKYFTRGIPKGAKGKRIPERYFLKASIREKICFIHGNVLAPQLLTGRLPYDIIFCRNLMIYFDQAARDRTTLFLNKMLKPGGLLFVGYAETGLIDPTVYQPVPHPQSFAYRKQTEKPGRQAAPATDSPTAHTIHKVLAEPTSQPPAAQPTINRSEATALSIAQLKSSQQHPSSVPSLALARHLADTGEIERSVLECDRYLARQPTAADAYLLRGELYQATGNSAAAAACFQKALYLNPQTIEALTHLMFLKEEQKDADGAALIRGRIQRLNELSVFVLFVVAKVILACSILF
ncbi:MAG: CheR family methyltransferase [Phormidesmis sp.]